jgi:F-type H+-transporting ATPase subunit c
MRKLTNFLSRYWTLGLASLLMPALSFAEEHAAAAGASSGANAWGVAAAALGLGIAVFGAASAQGRIAGSYMEGASRNPGADKVMKTNLILSLVFVETLVIFTLGIVAWIVSKS